MHALKQSLKLGGTLAQLVEQRTENPCVPGSIPGGTTKNPSKFDGFFDFKNFLLQVIFHSFQDSKNLIIALNSKFPDL